MEEDRWVGEEGGIHLKVFNSSCSHLYTQKKSNGDRGGNTTTPGIHGPRHEEGSE